jgi:hypothetical protein
MHLLFEWFREQSNFLTLLQIFLDLLMIALLCIFIRNRPRQMVLPGREELVDSLEQIVQETQQIATEFEANLQERHKLIEQVLVQLDLRLDEARKVSQQLEMGRIVANAIPAAPSEAPGRTADQQEILQLAEQGLDPQAIAARLKKPLGEVELIVKLRRLATG